MRFLPFLACLLALPAHAQEAGGGSSDVEAPEQDVALGGGVDLDVPPTERLLLDLAGPRASLVRSDEGDVRALVGARIGGAGTFAQRAGRLIRRFAPLFGLPAEHLVIVADLDVGPLHVVRFAEELGGVPVLGSHAVVRFAPDRTIDYVGAAPVPLVLANGDSVVRTAADALAVAGAVLPQAVEPHDAVAVLVPLFGELVPAWQLDVRHLAVARAERLFLDARSGAVLARLPRALDARGSVFANNPDTDMGMATEVELTDLTGSRLTGRYLRVASCNAQAGTGCAPVGYAEPDAAGDFLFAPAESRVFDDPFAEVNAYHHASVVARYFRDTHAFTWTCGASTSMEVLVNYSEAPSTAYDNAAYVPGGGSGGCGLLIFGEGSLGDFAYDGDVIYHEYGHAVTDVLTDILGFASNNLGVNYFPLAVNEGTSDYWAATIQGNPEVAESFSDASGLGGTGSLRVIANDLRCPNDLIGEGHFDGRIHSAVVWDLREALGADDADQILYGALGTYLGGVSLEDAAVGLRATAVTLAEMGMVDATAPTVLDGIIAAHGLVDCDRVVPLDDGATHQGFSGIAGVTGSIGRRIAPIHYRIDVPADATSLRIAMGRLTFAGRYTLHVRVGNAVRVASRIVSNYSVAGDVLLDASSELPLPRCQTVYVAVQVDDLDTAGESLYEIHAELTRSGDGSATCPDVPDGGMGADAGTSPDAGTVAPSAGCGCRAGSTSGGAGSAVLSAVALAAILRRRR